MELKTTLDVDLVAVETADEVAVLLDLAAPPATARPARALQVVLDRSGSMAGERLDAELLAEAVLLQSLADERDVRVAAKTLRADLHRKTQRRRR
jgi:Ca-activated chloride channel family protein